MIKKKSFLIIVTLIVITGSIGIGNAIKSKAHSNKIENVKTVNQVVQANNNTNSQSTKNIFDKNKHEDISDETTQTATQANRVEQQSKQTNVVINKSKVISDDDKQQALNLYNQGLPIYYGRDFYKALSLFNQALELNPNCYQALNGKGATEAFLGNYNEGISLIKQAISLNPNFEYAQFNLGLAYELAGNWDKAISAYQEAIKLNPKDAWAYYGIASIYGRNGNVDNTVENLKQAINIEPDAKETAKTEHDFDNVRNSATFQELLKTKTTSTSQPISAPQKVTKIPILYYHSIMVEPGNELRMPPEQFNEQMAYLSTHGYYVLTPDELYNDLYDNGTLPDKPILITFDDGYEDNNTNALPILKKYNFTATVFMVSSYINRKGFLTSDELKELQSAGWTIGGHTVNHLDFSKVDSNTVNNELKNSKITLENMLGKQVKYFCYPFGGYNSNVITQVKQSGYSLGFTTERGWVSKVSNPYLLNRVYCYANMGMNEFIKRITNPNY